MSDHALRELERAFAEGDASVEGALIAARLRAGTIRSVDVGLAQHVYKLAEVDHPVRDLPGETEGLSKEVVQRYAGLYVVALTERFMNMASTGRDVFAGSRYVDNAKRLRAAWVCFDPMVFDLAWASLAGATASQGVFEYLGETVEEATEIYKHFVQRVEEVARWNGGRESADWVARRTLNLATKALCPILLGHPAREIE